MDRWADGVDRRDAEEKQNVLGLSRFEGDLDTLRMEMKVGRAGDIV